MSQPPSWKIETGKTLVCDVNDVRLVIQRSNGQARFLVLYPADQTECCPETLLASGTETDLFAAMTAAEQILAVLGLSATEWRVL